MIAREFNSPLEALFDGVDDLIRRLAEDSPEIRKIRARVRANMVAAKSAIDDGAADSDAHPVREFPVPAAAAADYRPEDSGFGFGLLMALGLGFAVLLEPHADLLIP